MTCSINRFDRCFDRPPRHCGNCRARCAFTLLEMVVTISILSVVLALSLTTLVAMYRIERQFAGDAVNTLTIHRLASQFRADAHAASTATIAGDCQLYLPRDRRVHYTVTTAGITRVVVRGQETEHRDSFLFDRRAAVSFSFAPDTNDRLLQLRLAPATDRQSPRASSLRPLIIEAALNLYGPPADKETPP